MQEKTGRMRHELKFFIDEGEYLTLRERLYRALPIDPHADPASRQYHIRSLYFDDIYNSALWEKQTGVEFRRKYRLRIYNLSDSKISLERKTKLNQYILKESVPITRQRCDELLGGRFDFLYGSGSPVMEDLYAAMRTARMRPVVLVDYTREAYIYPPGNVRITFDLGLHTGNFSLDLFSGVPAPIPVLEPRQVILEVKYDAVLAPHIRSLLQMERHQRSAASKYVLCRRFH